MMNGVASRMSGVLVGIAAVAIAIGCGAVEPTTVVLTVDGMTCDSCSSAITDALSTIDGVETATADHVAGRAEAVVRLRAVEPQRLADEIEGLGFTVTDVTTVPTVD